MMNLHIHRGFIFFKKHKQHNASEKPKPNRSLACGFMSYNKNNLYLFIFSSHKYQRMLKFGTRNPSAILVLCTDKRDGNNLRDNTTCSCPWGMRCKLLVRWFKQNNIYPKNPTPNCRFFTCSKNAQDLSWLTAISQMISKCFITAEYGIPFLIQMLKRTNLTEKLNLS